MPEPENLRDLTALEALLWACEQRNTPCTPSPDLPDFEPRILAKCLKFFPTLGEPEALTLADLVRADFVRHPATADIPKVAQKAVVFLSKFKDDALDAKAMILLGVQITAALLSLMKSHSRCEYLTQAHQDLSDLWQRTEGLEVWPPLAEITKDGSLAQQRAQAAGLTVAVEADADRWDEILTGAFATHPHPEDLVSWSRDIASDLNANPQSIPDVVHALMFGPKPWLYRQYHAMNDIVRHALYLIESKQRELLGKMPVAETEFESQLRFESQTQQAVTSWLQNKENAGGSGEIGHFLSAMSRRENGVSDWYSGWMRCPEFSMPIEELSFWPHSDGCAGAADFQIFWRVLAWSESGEDLRAAETLETHLSQCNGTPQLWLLMAHIACRLHRYGQAEQALNQAGEIQPETLGLFGHGVLRMTESKWHQRIESMHHELADLALSHAQHSRVVEPSILELAMTHGAPETAAEAALCAFDARVEDLSGCIQILSERPDVLDIFVEKIALRRSHEHLEYLWELTQHIQAIVGSTPAVITLESLSQLDDAWTATGTLSRALHALPHSGALYWSAAELWIDLHCEMQTYDDAIMGVMDALASDSKQSTRLLIYLIARLPKAAYGMLQTLFIENHGREALHNAFARVQSYTAPVPAISERPIDWAELSLTMMPYPWQWMHHASRLQHAESPEEAARKSRRDQVLSAHGIHSHAHDVPPEPAQWIHEAQKKASNAFE